MTNPLIWGMGKKHPYNKNLSIIDHIESQARENSTQIALVDKNQSLTYQEMFLASQKLAKQLQLSGLKKSNNVVICMNSSNELIILILAVLINGANYTAIDKHCPTERLEYMLRSNRAKFLITEDQLMEQLTLGDTQLLLLSNLKSLHIAESESGISNLSQGQDIAYIIYTSGSTGKPKGIRISHSSVNNHMLWMAHQFRLEKSEIFLLKTALTFDASVWEIFLPLFIGSTLVIPETDCHANPVKIANYIGRYNITVVQLVPVIFYQLLATTNLESLKNLRYIFVGGESLSRKTKQLFYDSKLSCQLVNLYGPAEATIDTTFHALTNSGNDIEHDYIGRPIYNVNIYVLRDNDALCEVNEIGELYIEGDSLAQGYLDQSLTTQSFITKWINERPASLYKTGDLVRWTSSRSLEYVCRKDKQIKLNGVRVEVEEIKSVIQSYGTIFDCLLDCETHPLYEYKYLSCYLLPIEGQKIDLNDFKNFLATKLPSYMLPSRYHVIDKINLSLSGKLNLASIKKDIHISRKDCLLPMSEASKVAQKLYSIWARILNLQIENLSNESDFFEMGGDSISSFILLEEINKCFNIKLDITTIMLCSKFSLQLDYIHQFMQNKEDVVANLLKVVPLNSMCETVIFLIHPIGGTVFWYLPIAKHLDGIIQILAIQDPDIFSDSISLHSIEEMAEAYTKCILASRPQKRYIIGGASFGSTVAIEIAKKLSAYGREVDAVLIFDGWAIYPKQLNDEEYFFNSMYSQQQKWLCQFTKMNKHIFDFNNLFKVQTSRLKMLFDYAMQEPTVHLEIFKAKEIMSIFEAINDEANHWDNWTRNYNLHTVPGNHETMFFDDNAVVLANKIKEAVASINPDMS